MGTLADVTVGRGLPRGRGRLDPAAVGTAQRERLLRAMTAAVAERGYANVRIADVVARARVSRQSFYAQFDDKEQCFLAAHAAGITLILDRLGAWTGSAAAADPCAQARGAIETYLRLCAEEPEFARCMLVELPAAGPAGLRARLEAHRQIAALIAAWHGAARAARPDWPAVPAARARAVVGAIHDLVFDAVAGGADPRALLDDAVDAAFTLLQIPS